MNEDSGGVLVIAAHPDDEILGCGGTVALHAQRGDSVCSVVVCEGESLRYGKGTTEQEKHARQAASVLGVKDVQLLGLPDQGLDRLSLTEVISPLEKIIRARKPRIIYCQYGGDLNRDHQIVFEAAMVAARPTEGYLEAIYAYDTASSTEWAYPRTFAPDTWVDISSTIELKLKAMSCYETELKDYPHPRSLEALRNKARAWGNQCCISDAEVFVTVRRILRKAKIPV